MSHTRLEASFASDGDEMSDWKQFERSITWADLLARFTEATAIAEQYRKQHPADTLSTEAHGALHAVCVLYRCLRPLIGNTALLNQSAPPDAIEAILTTVAKVRRHIPVCAHGGNA